MDDLRAVMDAAGSERAALSGLSEGVPMCLLFAATYPERVRTLVCTGGMARCTYAEDYPWGTPAQAVAESAVELILPNWGDGSMVDVAAPSQAEEAGPRSFYGRLERATVSPGMLIALGQMFIDTDVRAVVSSVHAPALILAPHTRPFGQRPSWTLAGRQSAQRAHGRVRGRRPSLLVRELR